VTSIIEMDNVYLHYHVTVSYAKTDIDLQNSTLL